MDSTQPKKLDKSTDDRYVFNPTTRRYVLRRNAIGRRVEQMMSRGEICEHLKHHTTSEMLKQRDLMRSDLSDDKLAMILKKLVDLRIDEQLAQRTFMPNKPPKLKRTKKGKAATKAKTKRRFVVKSPPPQETTTDLGDTTAVDTEYASDSDISD